MRHLCQAARGYALSSNALFAQLRRMTDANFGIEKIVTSFLTESMKSFDGYPLKPTERAEA
jgi:hypothetical protein